MKISVITVCFNARDCIEQTINSVLSQTYKNIEYVIIDGASTDSTLDIIEKYRDNIQVLVSEEDGGIFYAMNKGINRATGDLLIFINAGDSFYSPETLEQAVSLINKPDAKLFYGDINVIEENGIHWVKTFRNTDKITLTSNCLCHQATLYRRELFEKIGGYDEKYPICADHELNLRALIKYKLKAQYIPIVVCNFTMGGYSTSRKNIKNTSRQVHEIALKHYGKFRFKLLRLILMTLRNINFPDRKSKIRLRRIITDLFGLNI